MANDGCIVAYDMGKSLWSRHRSGFDDHQGQKVIVLMSMIHRVEVSKGIDESTLIAVQR